MLCGYGINVGHAASLYFAWGSLHIVSYLVSLPRTAFALNNPLTHYPITIAITVALSNFFPFLHLDHKAVMALKEAWIQIMTPALIICDLQKINYHI